MNNESYTLNAKHFLFLWFGAAVSVAEILAGGLLAPLGFGRGLIAIILGHLIGTTILVLGGIIGTRERIPAILSSRISFGSYGAAIFSILNILQLVGWTAVMIISGGRSVNEITKIMWGSDNLPLWSIAIGGLVCLWLALGREGGWKRLNMVAVWLLLALTVVLSVVVFRDGTIFSKVPGGSMPFGVALELSVVMPLSWLPLIADYSRFAKDSGSAARGTWLGYFVGSCWMYIIGLGAAIVAGNPDPTAMMLTANLGLAALGIVVLATVTTTFLDAYSAGVSSVNLFSGLNEKQVALGVTVIGTGLALFFQIEKYENFLLTIGSVFAPMFAVLLTDYFILGNRRIEPTVRLNWGAAIAWALGVALYYQCLRYEFVIGATIPVMLLTGGIYKLIWRYTQPWNYCQKSPRPLSR
jgi:putative hydroxymethylpyrimidine transporter CytX